MRLWLKRSEIRKWALRVREQVTEDLALKDVKEQYKIDYIVIKKKL